MKNTFYTEFDLERLRESPRDNEYRTPFQIDRDRIIHSSEFRRLQGKTQVFLSGEYDFYRTRLTHSIETAQIGRSICNFLQSGPNSILDDDYFIDPDLVEGACLSHDLGHPPFGHAGERILHKIMFSYGGFEGNAQTLRIITEILYRANDGRRGMNPTRGFMDSVFKYKSVFDPELKPENHYIYPEQEKYLRFIAGENVKLLSYFNEKDAVKSIECQIMDWADDTAYALNDVVDSANAGFITIRALENWIHSKEASLDNEQNEFLEDIKRWLRERNYKAKLGSMIGDFVRACSLEEINSPASEISNRYKYRILIDPAIKKKADLLKKIAVDLVFRTPKLHQMEFKAHYLLTRMFEALKEEYIDKKGTFKLLPDFTADLIIKEEDPNKRARLVCDYLSGMTDAFAVRTYKRLFDPEFGSISEIF